MISSELGTGQWILMRMEKSFPVYGAIAIGKRWDIKMRMIFQMSWIPL